LITIRHASLADLPTIVDFQLRMARETEGLELDPAALRAGVGAVFADERNGLYFIAEIDGRMAGSLLITPEWSDWRNGTVLWIQSVFVHPDFRRSGVFRAMFEHLRELVKADSTLHGLRLYVHKDNVAAQRTYTSMEMDGEHYHMFEWMK
jgi:GNAT superfamily N-acetyltransferase